MAEKRMFSKKIIDSDAFIEMPLSTQALYFHLGMQADDDGFLNNAKKIQRIIGASEDDFKILEAKRFIIVMPEGVTIVKHWKVNNYIQSDRYHPTIYQDIAKQIGIKDNNVYTLDTSCIQKVSSLETQISIDKNRLGKSSNKGSRLPDDWTLPNEWIDEAKKINNSLSKDDISFMSDSFKDYWLSLSGQRAVKRDWLATWRNWVRNQDKFNGTKTPPAQQKSKLDKFL